jgi:Rrf2 family transcriptional regulator, nitric oxide-sensitive transcriptional repressor
MNKNFAFSEALNLALHAITVMVSKPDSTFSNKNISKKIGASEHHLSKVLQRLVKSKIIISQRGPKGGFKMSDSWRDSSLLDIYEIIEGPFEAKKCLLSRPICNGKCILGGLLENMNEGIKKALSSKKLIDVANSGI